MKRDRQLRRRLLIGSALAAGSLMSGLLVSSAAQAQTPSTPTVTFGTNITFNPDSANNTITRSAGDGAATTVDGAASALTVNLGTNGGSVINWNGFNVGAGKSVTFQTALADASVLNRVTGPGASQIDGSIAATNVSVWLVNPSGITFGSTGAFSGGALVLSTAAITDGAFTAGLGSNSYVLTGAPDGVPITINNGAILTGSNGMVAIAQSINHAGSIDAGTSQVALIAARDVTLDFAPGAPLGITISAGTRFGTAAVDSSGTISGGTVKIVGASDGGIVDNLLNIASGTLSATDINGRIVISTQDVAAGSGGSTDTAAIVTAPAGGNDGFTISATASSAGEALLSGSRIVLGDSVTTTGAQSYAGAVTLDAATALVSNGGPVSFAQSVAGAGNDLSISSGIGAQSFNGLADIGALTLTTSGTRTLNAGTYSWTGLTGGTLGAVTTNGALVLGQATDFGAVTLGSDSTISGASVNFTATVDGTTPGAQSLSVGGNATFGGLVGNGTSLSALSVTGTSAINGGSVITTGNQSYTGAVTLGANAVLATTANGAVSLGALAGGGNDLTVASGAGAQTFSGLANIGVLTLTTSGTKTLNAGTYSWASLTGGTLGAVTTNGALVLGQATDFDAVTLGSDSAITGAPVNFTATVDGTTSGTQSLAIGDNATFGGLVGSGASLSALSVAGTSAINGGSVTTTGAQSYAGPVTLGADVVLTTTANGAVSLGTVTGGNNDLTISSGAGAQTYNGLSGIDILTLTTSGTRTLNAGTYSWASLTGGTLGAVTTNGILTFSQATSFGAVTLGSATTLDSALANGALTLGPVSGGANNLVVTSGSGAQAFNGLALGALTLTTSGTRTLNAGSYIWASVETSDGGPGSLGAVTTNGALALGQATSFGAVTLGSDSTISGAAVTFTSTVDGTAPGAQSLAIGGNATFGGLVGNGTSLSALSVAGTSAINGGSVITTGNQSYTGAVTLGTTTILTTTANGAVSLGAVSGGGNDLTVDTGAGAQSYNGLSGIGALVLNTAGTRTFGAGSYSWASISTSDGGIGNMGATTLDGALTLSQATSFGVVTVKSDSTITGAPVNFTATVDGTTPGGQSLGILGASNDATFAGLVGGATSLSALSVAGATNLNAVLAPGESSVVTTGAQSYAGPVTLNSDTILTTLANGAVSLGTLAGGNNDLTISSGAGAQTFNGLANIDVLTLTTSGIKTLNGGTYSWTILTGGTLGAVTANGTLTLGQATSFGAVTLGSSTTLDSGAANGDLTLGPVAGGGNDLVVTSGLGAQTFNGLANIGALTLTTSGTKTLNSGAYSWTSLTGGTLGAVTTNGTLALGQATSFGDLTLGSNTALNNAPVTFTPAATVNSTTPGGQSLDIGGDATFGSFVGNTAALSSLSVTGASTFNASGLGPDASVTTTGNQSYGGAVTLAAGTRLVTNTNGSVTLGAVSAAGNDLTIDSGAGEQSYNGLSGVGALVLNTTGTRTLSDGTYSWTSVTTTDGGLGSLGATTLDGALALGQATDFGVVTVKTNSTITGAPVNFTTTVDGTAPGGQSLGIGDNATFAGLVGNGTALLALSVTGTTLFSAAGSPGAPSVKTTGDQSYTGAVTLDANTALSGALVGFGSTVRSTIDGGSSLDIAGNASFGGAVGDAGLRLDTVSVSGASAINGSSVTTSNNQSYTGPTTLGANATLTGALVTFGSTLRGATDNLFSLDIAGDASFGGAVGDNGQRLTSLSVSGTSALNGGSVTTTGAQSYTGAATLGANATTLTGALVSFGSTLRGATDNLFSLAITGNASFGGAVGDNGQRLTTLSVSGTSALNGGSVTTTGAQSYTGAVALGTGTALTTAGGAVALGALTGGGNDLTINSGAGVQSYNGLQGIDTLDLITSSPKTLNAGTYSWTTLTGGTLDATRTNGTLTFGQATDFGAVTVESATTIAGAPINFTSTVDGATAGGQSLIVQNDALFASAVGGTTSLSALSVTGASAINGGSVITTGDQSYGGPVTLGGPTVLSGNAIGFASTVGGAVDGIFSLDITGNATFGGAVGDAGQRLSALTVSGTSAINGGSVTTVAEQTYTGATTLGANTVLTGTPVTFGSTVRGAADNLYSLAIAGNAIFGGAVGDNGQRLTSLAVSGVSVINGGSVVTSGNQSYAGATTLGANTALTGALVSFGSTVRSMIDGGSRLDITGNASFGGAVGDAGLRLASLSITGTSALIGGSVTTTGNQSYIGPVALGVDTVLTTAGGAVTLAPVTGGGNDLTISTGAGPQTLNGLQGIDTLTLTSTGSTTLNAATYSWNTLIGGTLGKITTNGTLTFGQATSVGAVTVQSDSIITGAPINFTSTVDGATAGGQSLTVQNDATFGGAVGSATPLAALTVLGASVINGGSVVTAGSQSYGGPVTLGAATVLTTTANGAVSLGAVTGGGNDFTVSSGAGVQSFNGLANIGTLTLVTSSPKTLNSGTYSWTSLTGDSLGAVNTNGALTLGQATNFGAITLLSDTVLDSAAVTGALTFGPVTGGGRNLTVASGSASQTFNGLANIGALTLTTSAVKTLNSGTYSWTSLTGGTLGNVLLNGALALGQSTTFAAATLGSNTVLSGGPVTFTAALNGAEAGAQTLDVQGNATFGGLVGNGAALASLSVSGSSAVNGGGVTTTGNQSYAGAVTLGADAAFANTGTGNLSFGTTIDSASAATPRSLTINSAGTTTLAGDIGRAATLRDILVNQSTTTPGPVSILGNVAATGLYKVTGTSVMLGNGDQNAGGAVTILAKSGDASFGNVRGASLDILASGAVAGASATAAGGSATVTADGSDVRLDRISANGGDATVKAKANVAGRTGNSGLLGHATGALTIDSGAMANVGASDASNIRIASDDVEVSGKITGATSITLVNRANGVVNDTEIGTVKTHAAGAFAVSADEIVRLDAPTVAIETEQAGAPQSVMVGSFDLGTASARLTRFAILTSGAGDTATITLLNPAEGEDFITGDNYAGTLQIGGNVAGEVATDSVTSAKIEAHVSGTQINLPNAIVDLRAKKILFGLDTLFENPTITGGNIQQINDNVISDSSSPLYYGGAGAGIGSPTGSGGVYLKAKTLRVKYQDFALFQNTATGGKSAGVDLGPDQGSPDGPVSLRLDATGSTVNGFALFGRINGVDSDSAGLLTQQVIQFSDDGRILVSLPNTRVNGCAIGSPGQACLVNNIPDSNFRLFDERQTQIQLLDLGADQDTVFDPIIGTNNEGLIGDIASPSLSRESESCVSGSGEEACPDGGNQQ